MGNINWRMDVDATGAVEAFRKMTVAQQQAELRSVEYSLKLKRMGSDVDSLGERGARAFATWGAGLLSVGSATAALKAGLERINAEMEKAGELGRKNAPTKMSLFQLGGGDPTRTQFLVHEMEKSRLQVGMTAQEAADLQMTLTSAGQEKHREYFAGFQAIIDPNALATGASKLAAGYGEANVGGLRAATNKILKAGEISGVKTDLLAPAISDATQIAQEIGSAHEELLGIVSQMTFATKSPEVAVTRLRSFGQKLGELGLGGEGFIAGAERLRPEMEAMDQSERMKHLGSVEAFMGYKWLVDNGDKAANAIREIRKAGEETGAGDLSERMKKLIDLPMFRTEKAARIDAIARQKLEIEKEGIESPVRLWGDAVRSGIQQRLTGKHGPYRLLSDMAGGVSEWSWVRGFLGEEQSAGLAGSVETGTNMFRAAIGELAGQAMPIYRRMSQVPGSPLPLLGGAGGGNGGTTVVHQHYGPQYHLQDRQNLHESGRGGPQQGLD